MIELMIGSAALCEYDGRNDSDKLIDSSVNANIDNKQVLSRRATDTTTLKQTPVDLKPFKQFITQ